MSGSGVTFRSIDKLQEAEVAYARWGYRLHRKNAMATNILDDIDLCQLGELLQQARKKSGMTQADAAKVIDAARTTIVAIEKGDRRLKPKELNPACSGLRASY